MQCTNLNKYQLLLKNLKSVHLCRQKHSQTSLQILDDVSNRYYREMELQTKSNFKEKDPSILRHDMVVQTSLCSTDDSSTTITDPPQQQPPAAPAGVNACDMGCQTR